ncbi:lysine-specific demethylase 5B isoform X1 [Amborella trichopoda]|uniref:lysine-specific demethylase 5B isoform X1 n=2 Tax=Amborella trichopoda TaxID=13333 RepID=UPI0009BD51F0|nr:lysine-specific demethylase 5B isoform X1 [Amborella trichopoda]|eukprot:XP_020527065.1 lysine-specific demethylase 5B isoform X1 [Amborella trichopoda]
MGKARVRARTLGEQESQSPNTQSFGALNLPQAPVYYPTEEEFKDPLGFIEQIRGEAERYGICRIVPPKSWKPPFSLELDSFTFPTKTQPIHQLQVRSAPCDPKTFDLDYNRFLDRRSSRKLRKKVVFEGEELDLCRLFNAVKRYGGYDKVVTKRNWVSVARVMFSSKKISACSLHVLGQLYREYLYDYEVYHNKNSKGGDGMKRVSRGRGKCGKESEDKNCKGSFLNGATKRIGRERKKFDNERCKVGESNDHVKNHKSRSRKDNGSLERESDIDEETMDQVCEQCKSGLHGEVMLLCDRCNRGWHLHCLSPPLKRIPPGDWYCFDCINSEKDSFGFIPGKQVSLESFQRLADRTRKRWFGSSNVSHAQIEKRFWEIVEGSAGEVEVIYGSDLDTSIYGSGFPRPNDVPPIGVDLNVWKEYSTSPWNLNNLPKLQGSVLRAVRDNIAGVMVPWLYVGMLFSSFCWHVEDHCFYSMNYLHWGEPKCWYSVPGNEAHAFEQVMRETLPDLFEAQPDLLFHLVTLLNPAVLREHDVSVYGVVQEAGNFVITFPRSFHAGFNFGLNCAEAVNFAPADWLPHGGLGAELYQSYHKTAVISHEELLCVVAKSSCNTKALPYLKKEMLRVFSKEKTQREKLWKIGTVRSSMMSPRKQPEYVGTEEDPECIICRQYLYLSAVVCDCRPTAFACLEHWKHLCECSPDQHRLMYRYTVAELEDLLLMVSPGSTRVWDLEMKSGGQSKVSARQLTKKVKGCYFSHSQLADAWLADARQIFQLPFSEAASVNALQEAEQFLWAGHEMDSVRDMAKSLIEAQKWAENSRLCLSKVESSLNNNAAGEVHLKLVEELLASSSLSCNEPSNAKLKAFADGARMLDLEIKAALSSRSLTVAELEALHFRAVESPIILEECQRLEREISSAKAWQRSVQRYSLGNRDEPVDIDADALYKLKAEMLGLHVQLPEVELLNDLLEQVELWNIRTSEILKGPLNLKELETLLHDADAFSFCTPEMKLLRHHHGDALAWIDDSRNALEKIKEREDYYNIVEELSAVVAAGQMLKVQVGELPLIEEELRKSSCRARALKVLSVRMPMDFIMQLLAEATLLHLEDEKMFSDMDGILSLASSLEERAKLALSCSEQMLEFEDIIRMSQNVFVILPSLNDVKEAISTAESWIRSAQPFLLSFKSGWNISRPLLKVNDLKELLNQSKLLKVSLKEPEILQRILHDVDAWQSDAASLFDQTNSLIASHVSDCAPNGQFLNSDTFIIRIEELVARIDFVMDTGRSLGFDFHEIPKLQDAAFFLRWSLKALSLCSGVPLLEEADCVIEDAAKLPCSAYVVLEELLLEGARWVRKASLVISGHPISRCKLKDAEEILDEAQILKVSFPAMTGQLMDAIEKHKVWQKEVQMFLGQKLEKCSWPQLLQLEEFGKANAFDCMELDRVGCEVAKVNKWMLHCKYIIGHSVGDPIPLVDTLVEIRDSLDLALRRDPKSGFGICNQSAPEIGNVKNYSTCDDRGSCMGTEEASLDLELYKCKLFMHMENGAFKNRKQTKNYKEECRLLDGFVQLLHEAKTFYPGIKEQGMVEQIVELALECQSRLNETVTHALSYHSEDISSITRSLLIAMKAVEVVGIHDNHIRCKLKLVLSRHSWKMKTKRLLEGTKKPLVQQIRNLLKEGSSLDISLEDHYLQKLKELEGMCSQWANRAKQVASDYGLLELDKVFQLITEGENLPIHFEKELELLRARSVLYCICRKPYDQRAMIACDRCNEWYHFDCINLQEPAPEEFFCPACRPLPIEEFACPTPSKDHERSRATIDWASDHNLNDATSPSKYSEIIGRRRPRKARSSLQRRLKTVTNMNKPGILYFQSELDHLWRKNRRPCNRAARKRRKLTSLASSMLSWCK